MKHSNLFIFVLIIILGIAVYANSLEGKFLWDDRDLIEENMRIRSFLNSQKIFTEHIGAGVAKQSSSYRPIQIFTYMIDYSLWRLNPKGYHITNTLLHILAALSLFWLISIIFKDNLLSMFTSILFVVHPIHTEAVTYISGRADCLAAFFMLLCFAFYIKQLNSKSLITYILMLLSYILALLSRENSLILPALLLLYHYAFNKKLNVKNFTSILGILFAYILLRATIFIPSTNTHSFTFSQRLPGFFAAITNYLKLLILPFNLHMEYGLKLFSFQNPKVILGIILLFSLLIFAFKKKTKNNMLFFSMFWFFIALLPSSNLYPINAYMAEHWLYIPSIGFFLIFAKVLTYLYRTKDLKIPAIIFIISLIAFYSFLTIEQNNYWKEPLAFYERTLEYTPNSARVLNNLANIYHSMGKTKKAIALNKKAIEIKPDYDEAYNNLGTSYHFLGRDEEAIKFYKKAIEVNPTYAVAYSNLGASYHAIGKDREAIDVYEEAIKLNPENPAGYNNLGVSYQAIGEYEMAILVYKKALEIAPSDAAIHFNLSVVYFRQGQYNLAIKYCDKAITLEPEGVDKEFLEALKPYRK